MKKSIFSLIVLMCALTGAAGQSRPLQRDDFLKPRASVIRRDDFFKPYGKAAIVSTCVCVAGDVADVVSSRHRQEMNGFLRNGRGEIATTPALVIGLAPCAASFLIERRHPKLASFIRLFAGGVHFGAAAHNWRIPPSR